MGREGGWPGVDVLIPTYRRAGGLAVTLASLVGQTYPRLRVVVSDQTEEDAPPADPGVQAVVRALRGRGRAVELHRHVPRRGLAEHRQYLLDHAVAPLVLMLDDDMILEPEVVARLVRVQREQGCGFVGAACIGLSYLADVRPHEQPVELWEGPVSPETIVPGTPQWERFRLHNAANLHHVQKARKATDAAPVVYKVAWTGGCVLYDAAALRAVRGFEFYRELPAEACGEDVLAQLRVMAEFGGCGVMPSGVYHQELPTTVPTRHLDAPLLLQW